MDTFCPGSNDVTIADLRDAAAGATDNGDGGLEGWAIALLVALGVVAAVTVLAVTVLVMREKSGNPMFSPVGKEME